ncbi:MAG: ABC transporter permease [Firmicutes bacterium]|nr:ABC transporter permease [Bacillota bacterium]
METNTSAASRRRILNPGALRRWWFEISYPLITLVGLILLWQLYIRFRGIPVWLIPAPTDIASEFLKSYPTLLKHGIMTTKEIILGFGLAVLVGFPIGIGISISSLIERTVYPLLVSTQSFPKSAVAPLLIIWFGFGIMPKVMIAFMISFFPIVVNTVVGLRSINPDMIQLVRSMGAGALSTFIKVRFPNALPTIFAGLKTAMALSVVGAVVGEFVGADQGLGYLILFSQNDLKTKLLFAALTFVSLIGIGLFSIVSVLERLFIPWHVSVRKETGSVAESQ